MALMRRRGKMGELIVLAALILSIFLLALSARSNLGIGIDAAARLTGWGPDRAFVEASLVRGGVLFVMNGTRTDSVSSYERSTGASTFNPFGQRVYVLDVEPVIGKWVWMPRLENPGGTYLFVPLWPFVVGFGAASFWIVARRRARVAGTCLRCGYVLTGLGAGAVCPECGMGQ